MARFQRQWYDAGTAREDQIYRPLPMNRQGNTNNTFVRPQQYQFNEPGNRVQYLSNLCNDLIRSKDSHNNPVSYAHFVISSIFDNADVDLCLVLPRYDKEHEELTHKLGCLVGYDSTTFKLIFSDETLFEYFLDNFTRHAELSNSNFGSASASLYIWLLNGYLQRILPISDIELASVQMSTLFNQSSKRLPTRKISRTPFQLLREDLFLNTSDSFDDVFEFDRSNYSRLFQFVELLISSFTNTSISPSPAQIVALKNVVEAYIDFLLAPTLDHDLETFKSRLRGNRQFSHLMHNYLKTMLSNNAINEAFVYHFQILIALIGPTDSMVTNPESFLLFKRCSASRFIDLLDTLLDRFSNSDIRTLIRLELMQFYIVVLFNNNFIRMLCDLHVSAVDYLKPIQRRLNAVVEPNVNESAFVRLTSFMNEIVDNNEDKSVRTYLAIINDRLKSPYVTFPPSELEDRPPDEESFIDVSNVTVGAMNTTLNRKPRIGMPDYYVDSWNSMYFLTPKGIDQVLSGQARFDFSQYGKQIYAAQGKCRWENKWLAEKLQRVALRLVHHPIIRYLRRASNNKAVGPILRPFMMPRSPPREVPVYGKNIPRHLETLNLRILASYPVIFIILWFVWKFIVYLFSFVF